MATQATQRRLLDLTVLGFLAERPMHPYAICRQMRRRQKDFVSGLPRSLYYAIGRLERLGLVAAVEVRREQNRPERTVYEITVEGRQEFAQSLAEMISEPDDTEYPVFTAAVSFVGHMTPMTVGVELGSRAARLQGRLAALDAELASGRANGLHRLSLLEKEHSRVLCAAELGWVREVEASVASGELDWDAAEILRAAGEPAPGDPGPGC